MGRPVDNGGGDSGEQYESFAQDVNVNITDFGAYYKEMLDVQLDASGPAGMEVGALGELIRASFLNADGDVGAFPEGAVLARSMQHRQSDFNHFMTDVLEGVRNIGAAAVVVAEMYHGTDFNSAAGVDDIAFAFSDPNAKGPKGFRKVESFSEAEMRMREEAGQDAMALSGNDSLATVSSPYGGIMIYNFSDGSSKQVVTTSYGDGHSTTTTIFGPNGKVLQSTTEEVRGQNRNTSHTSYTGENGTGTRSTTETTTDDDGTVTVTQQSDQVNSDGKVTKEGEEHTITVKTGDHRAGEGEQGPIEAAENKLGTSGTERYVRDHGMGY